MAEPALLAILVVSSLVIISIFSSVLSFRVGAPLLLVFLAIGLLAGEDGIGGINFEDAELAFWGCSLALAVILFDSGFATSWRSYRKAARPAITLAVLGTVATAGIVAVGAKLLLPIDWTVALLLGACVSSTDAAAVFFLLRTGGLRIQEKIRATLEIESGTNDPVAIFMVVAILSVATGVQDGWQNLPWMLVQQAGLGVLIGVGGGFLMVRLINLLTIETALYAIAVLGMALLVFSATTLLGGSGFLAVYLAGLIAGNRQLKGKYTMRRFQSGLTWLAQILMFVTLGLFAVPSTFIDVLLPALGLALVLTFVARPAAVIACLWPQRYRPNEVAFTSWVGLRGAVSILLAILPLRAGMEDAQMLFNVVFLVVIFSLLIQGWTVKLAAERFKVMRPIKSGMIDRIELELPGRSQHELVAYRLADNSPALGKARIPRWARPSLVVRHGDSLRPHQAGELTPGDTVYLFCAERHVPLLDRIYTAVDLVDERDFLGDFSLPPDTKADSIAKRFGLSLPHDMQGKTLRDIFNERLRGRIELGDRIPIGPFELIVRDLSAEGVVEEVGLLLDDPDLVRR